MIRIDRKTVEKPEFLQSEVCDELRRKAATHFGTTSQERRRFKFNLGLLRSKVDLALDELFKTRCTYCERILVTSKKVIKAPRVSRNFEHFRPKTNALGFEKESSPLHYWWLFYEWENLYIACQICNTNKRTQFPVYGSRAEAPVYSNRRELQPVDWKALREEKAYLLDPCLDEPSEHLHFNDDGLVVADRIGKMQDWQRDRGEVTIDILGLNRRELVQDRKTAARRFLQSAPSLGEYSESPTSPFLALRRQIWARRLLQLPDGDHKQRVQLEFAKQFSPILEAERERLERTGAESTEISSPEHLGEIQPSVPAISTVGDEVLSGAATLESVSLTNFRAIHSLELNVPGPLDAEADSRTVEDQSTTQMAWLTFLGENGSGKSSILQAVAMALAGPNDIQNDQCLKDPKVGCPERSVMRGKRVARVKIRMSTLPNPISLKITNRGFEFESWENPATFVRAYGATRLPPRGCGRTSSSDVTPPAWYGNLFDPFTPLVDVDAWLADLQNDTVALQAARQCFEDLLGLGPEPGTQADSSLLRVAIDVKGKLTVDGEPLENLSSGYQTLIALGADIMAGVPQSLSDMQQAAGIILLDEIGAHLHPGWKMRIVARIRTAFAGMQFLATTHEPLCLRGLHEGEVALVTRQLESIPRSPNRQQFRVRTDTDLPSPERMRVDQLLTSKHFGLESTIDPVLDGKFKRYYQLLAHQEEELTPQQIAERDELAVSLQGVGILGYTRRDQLIYEAIDKYLAEEKALERERASSTDEEKKRRKDEVMKRVADLWRYARWAAD